MPTVAKLAAIKAMDGLYLRASAIAENIANANSQSFHLKSVDFEGELRKAVLAGPQALAQFAPRMTSAMSPVGGDDIRLDLEMAADPLRHPRRIPHPLFPSRRGYPRPSRAWRFGAIAAFPELPDRAADQGGGALPLGRAGADPAARGLCHPQADRRQPAASRAGPVEIAQGPGAGGAADRGAGRGPPRRIARGP